MYRAKLGFIGRVGKRFSTVSKIEHKASEALDFDRWMKLAQDDPESFEATRAAVIEQLIESFPVENRERMRRLQWRIDQERRLAKSPMGACMRLSKMMWRQLLGEGGLRDRLQELAVAMGGGEHQPRQPRQAAPARSAGSARVLAFSRAAD